MSPLTRRQLLGLGLVGAGAAATGGVGLWWNTAGGPAYTADGDLVEPRVLTSRNGVLELELSAAPARFAIGGRDASVLAFNGSLPGPTWRVRGGDSIRVRMRNELDAPTNLHVHGLHVSPEGNSDNPFVSIDPGESFDYEFVLPEDHPPGTYWYHPHRHGYVADQLSAGLYGAIIVEESEPIPATRERIMVISDLTLDASGSPAEASQMQKMMGREGDIVLVNGMLRPSLRAAPGERERWRIVNACVSRYLRLQLDGQQVRLLSRDLGRLPVPEDVTEVILAPGNRVELIIETTAGSSTLVASQGNRGSMGAMMGGRGSASEDSLDLLTLTVSGTPGAAPGPVPDAASPRDLRSEPVAARRTLEFAVGMGRAMRGDGEGMGGMGGMGGDGGTMMTFTVNGQEFDPNRTDTRVIAGTVEEWTLTNPSPMDHPIHLHVWPMQVIQDGEREVAEPRWQDVVNVPARSKVKVLVAFEGFPGRTVYHCHILDHEDQGMMATVEAR